jgi:hypothetical protein
MVSCPFLPWTTSAAVYSWHVHSLSSLVEQYRVASDQVQGAGYFESKVETDMAASGQVVSQKILNQERYSAD